MEYKIETAVWQMAHTAVWVVGVLLDDVSDHRLWAVADPDDILTSA